MLSNQEKHRALAEVIKQHAIKAGLWHDDPPRWWPNGVAEPIAYYSAARHGAYARVDGVEHPERFGMTDGEFRAVRKMIYGSEP